MGKGIYLLVCCMRYIEMNPVRANMVRHPSDYRWSSFRCNAEAADNHLTCHHGLYQSLGLGKVKRAEAYYALFATLFDPGELTMIRQSVNCSMPTGDMRRDYARFGQMLLQRGKLGDVQLVPAEWIDDIQNADHGLFHEPYTLAAPNGGYRNQFWIEDVDRPGYMARRVFGQIIYVDPGDDMVVVKLSSWPEFTSVSRLKTMLNAINAIGKHLNR